MQCSSQCPACHKPTGSAKMGRYRWHRVPPHMAQARPSQVFQMLVTPRSNYYGGTPLESVPPSDKLGVSSLHFCLCVVFRSVWQLRMFDSNADGWTTGNQWKESLCQEHATRGKASSQIKGLCFLWFPPGLYSYPPRCLTLFLPSCLFMPPHHCKTSPKYCQSHACIRHISPKIRPHQLLWKTFRVW